MYEFHQTPETLAKDLIQFVPLVQGDIVAEPFKGEGAFYNHFPDFVEKKWAEKEQGISYTSLLEMDWVITNPPFQLESDIGRVNSFWFLLDYFSTRSRKGIAFLGNDRCLSSLTPKRLGILKDRGFSITKVIVCSVKKWRGRYFFIILEKNSQGLIDFLPNNY